MSIPGSNIRFLRRQLGLTQKALADSAGVDLSSLSRLESGKGGYSAESIDRLAKALSVSTSVLFADSEKVERASLHNQRDIPVLTAQQLMVWRGAESINVADDRYLRTDVRRVSRHAFAIEVPDAANAPIILEGDHLVFDANKQPRLGNLVIAHDDEERLHIGRFRALPEQKFEHSYVDAAAHFTIVPADPLFEQVQTTTTPGLRLRGVCVEHRRYL